MVVSSMDLEGAGRRRWAGAICLMVAFFMLIAGETILKGRLGTVGFLIYWLFCFLFTMAAIIVALLDVRAVARKAVAEQRNLMEGSLHKVEGKANTSRSHLKPSPADKDRRNS